MHDNFKKPIVEEKKNPFLSNFLSSYHSAAFVIMGLL